MRPAPILTSLLLAGSVEAALAQSSARGPLCEREVVVTGAVANARLTGDIARANPAMAQAAALVARVDPAQQPEARYLAQQRLRAAGVYNEDIFTLLLMDAKQGQSAAAGAAAVMGGTAGVIAGGLTGKLVDGMTGSEGLAGLAGVALGARGGADYAQRLLGGEAIKITLDRAVVDPVLDDLFRNPCEISAADALARLRTN